MFRIKKADFDMNKVELKNGTFNHLMNSEKMEFVTENPIRIFATCVPAKFTAKPTQ